MVSCSKKMRKQTNTNTYEFAIPAFLVLLMKMVTFSLKIYKRGRRWSVPQTPDQYINILSKTPALG